MTDNTSIPPTPPANSEPTDGLAIASLILGILSITGFLIFTGIPAIITGILSLRKKRSERGMSIAGIIMGSLGTLLSLLIILAFILLVALGAMDNSPSMYNPDGPSFDSDMPVESSRT